MSQLSQTARLRRALYRRGEHPASCDGYITTGRRSNSKCEPPGSPCPGARTKGGSKSVSLDKLFPRPPSGPPSSRILFENEAQDDVFLNGVKKDEKLVYAEFMRAHKCYDLIPISSKLVVFDTQLLVKKAFFALVYNGVRAAPLWDSNAQQFVGMLTITDFINILRKYHASPAGINQQLEENKICNWKAETSVDKPRPLISIDVNASLYAAIQALCDDQVHRLPVMDFSTGNVLYILTHKRILRFLYLYMNDLPEPEYMKKTPKQLGIGTWANVLTVTQDTKLVEALKMFVEKRVSALPVLDDSGAVVDIYAKFDVINLAAEKAYNNLNITVKEALSHRLDWFEGVLNCNEDDSLFTVVETIVKAEVHRILICDKQKRVKGVVSLSDLLRFLVLNPHTDEPMDTS